MSTKLTQEQFQHHLKRAIPSLSSQQAESLALILEAVTPEPTPAMPRLLSLADVAEMFGVEVDLIRRWSAAHGWPSVKVGRTRRFRSADVEAILLRHLEQPSTAAPTRRRVGVPGQTARSAAYHWRR